jgi:alanine racemase
LPIYLKLNTGMNRLGLNLDEFRQALPRLQACRGVAGMTLMTHFADADGPCGVAGQMARFAEFNAGLDLPACLANSAALLRYPETLGAWARPGIMLYGSSPFPEVSAESLGLLPVMTLESQIIAVRELQAGDTIGYGNSFTAERPMRVGVVACGYADGYPRHAPTGTPVLVADRRSRTLGRVSMDKLCVDITEIPAAGVGAPVVLWGEGLSADEVASAAGTVSYELFCALAQRVPVVEA